MKRFDIYFVKSALRRRAIQDLYATLGEMLDHDDESSAGFADGLRELVEKDFKRTLKTIDRECARFFRQRRKRFSDVQYDAEFFCYLAELGIALPELEKLRNCANVEESPSIIAEEVASEETAEEQPATEESNEQETVNDSAAEPPEEPVQEDGSSTEETPAEPPEEPVQEDGSSTEETPAEDTVETFEVVVPEEPEETALSGVSAFLAKNYESNYKAIKQQPHAKTN